MIRLLSNSEFRALESSLDQFSRKEQALLSILMYCGLRVGELVQLIARDISFKQQDPVELRIRASTTKTSVGRYVPIPKRCASFLDAYLDSHNESPPYPSYDSFLFSGSGSRSHMSVHGVEQLVSRISLQVLGKRITPHVFRHTYATRLLKYSNVREVQLLLGHKKLSSTQVYTHPSIHDLTKSVNRAFD